MKKFRYIIYILLLLTFMVLLILNPSSNMVAFGTGLNIWANKVVPALFPFMVLTMMLAKTPLVTQIGQAMSRITRKMYGISGNSTFAILMSVISGYPTGARTCAMLYNTKQITKEDAIRTMSVASTSGPLFILGTVGAGMIKNMQIGVIILISHILGSCINGLIYKGKYKSSSTICSIQTNTVTISNIISSACSTMLVIGGYISMCMVAINALSDIGLLKLAMTTMEHIGVSPLATQGIVMGIIEVTCGCNVIGTLQNPIIITSTCTALISFGGLCIHMQCMTFAKDFGMKYGQFLIQKITHCIIATVISVVMGIIIFT